MRYIDAMKIIEPCLDSLEYYEQIPKGARDVIRRLLDDLHYTEKRHIKEDSLEHFKKYYPHLFEGTAKDTWPAMKEDIKISEQNGL